MLSREKKEISESIITDLRLNGSFETWKAELAVAIQGMPSLKALEAQLKASAKAAPFALSLTTKGSLEEKHKKSTMNKLQLELKSQSEYRELESKLLAAMDGHTAVSYDIERAIIKEYRKYSREAFRTEPASYKNRVRGMSSSLGRGSGGIARGSTGEAEFKRRKVEEEPEELEEGEVAANE
eukprot:TRINITY_DN4941_c0_g1_i1.p1 TRINITY_DN4941_c0_g1~~TRINITY_DN4941_c0_g1_i1.p1  ORF type:complete len:200 (-),score=53.85 TRINITY_DN4941_c0_g1_i1:18-563(-)